MIYYGYKRGDDNKIVDWSGVTKSLTDRLDEVEDKRAANRERIEGEIADATQKISDVPMGNYENINSFMIQTSTDIAENLRVNSALLRAGKMKASEWAKFSQNSVDAIGQYKKIAENYNSLRDKGVSRLNEGKSGWQEAHELERLEKLADLTRTVSVQDPITGVTFNAPIGKDGRPDMSQAESTLYLANMPFVEMNKFDMNAQLDPTVEKYGENVEVIKSLGVNTKSSIKIRKDFEESVNTFIGSFDSRQLASVLGDFIGGYKGTTDESLVKSKPEEYILIGRDGSNGNFPTYKLTPDQETKAREAIKEQLYMKLDYVETPTPTTGSGQTEADKKSQSAADAALEETTRLWNLFTGDEAKKAEIMDVYRPYIEALLGKGNYGGYDITENQIILYQRIEDGLEPRVIDIPSDFKSFVDLASTNFGLSKNLDEMYDKSTAGIEGFNPAAKYVTATVQKRPSIIYKPTKTIEDAASDLEGALGEIDGGFTGYNKTQIEKGQIALDAAAAADSYLTGIGLTGALVEKGEGNSVKITINGITPRGGIVVNLRESRSGARTDLKTALKVIHDAAGMGQLVTGYPTAEKTPDPANPDPANPAGKDVITVEDLPD